MSSRIVHAALAAAALTLIGCSGSGASGSSAQTTTPTPTPTVDMAAIDERSTANDLCATIEHGGDITPLLRQHMAKRHLDEDPAAEELLALVYEFCPQFL